MKVRCPVCEGMGGLGTGDNPPDCYRCKGEGEVEIGVKENCDVCCGSGDAPIDAVGDPVSDRCAECNGTGKGPALQYVNAVMARLPELTDPREVEMFRSDAESRFLRGYTLEDCVRFMRLTEHVNPEIPEAVALRKMAEIEKRYK